MPAALRRFVERCLEKKPQARWRDTQEAYEELERIQRPAFWRKAMLPAIGLVLLGVVLAQVGREDERGLTLRT
ncbi:MAG: hypothetical protein ACI8X5_003927 [Planctomycetota bacterium]